MEIQKIEPLEDGTIRAYGYASAPVRDAHGEIVTAAAMSAAIDDYMRFPSVREMHDATKAAGRCLEINLDDNDRTAFIAHVVDPIAVKKVKAGVYNGFSIGGQSSAAILKTLPSFKKSFSRRLAWLTVLLAQKPPSIFGSVTMRMTLTAIC